MSRPLVARILELTAREFFEATARRKPQTRRSVGGSTKKPSPTPAEHGTAILMRAFAVTALLLVSCESSTALLESRDADAHATRDAAAVDAAAVDGAVMDAATGEGPVPDVPAYDSRPRCTTNADCHGMGFPVCEGVIGRECTCGCYAKCWETTCTVECVDARHCFDSGV